MTAKERMALTRERRRKEGMRDTTVWLTPDDQKALELVAKKFGAANQSEAIKIAVREFSKELGA
jgi:hypothetical protein